VGRRYACAMYYAPRYAPEKPGMPVLGYFTIVGGILLGSLFVADAYMPRHEQLSFVSNVDGLPEAYKGEPKHIAAAPHVAPAPAIAETTGSSGFALAGEEPKRTPSLATQTAPAVPRVVQEAAKPAPRKIVRKRHQPDDDGSFGSNRRQDFGRQDFARQDFGSREPFGSHEPSWRDSWASGTFQQREARTRRSTPWRNENSNFWHFR
jgi:hypothetical protein